MKPKFFYGYIVLPLAFLMIVVIAGPMYSFGVFLEPLSTQFGWSRSETSGAYSLLFILQGLLAIIAGRLNDRFGPRIVMTICGFFLGLGYLLMSQINSVWQLYLYYGVITGIGMSGSLVPLISTVARWFVKRRNLVTGITASGASLGIVIVPILANQIISKYSWQTAYIVVGSVALVLIIVAAQFLKRDPSEVGLLPYGESDLKYKGSVKQAQGLSLQEVIRTHQFWILFAAFFCYGFCVQTTMVNVVPHAIDMGISATSAASILTCIGALAIVGRITISGAGDRIGSNLSMVISLTLMAISFVLLLIAKELWELYLLAAIFGFSYAGFMPSGSVLIADLFGLRAHGAVYGIATAALAIGGSIGPFLAGHIFDTTGSYHLAFLVCIILNIIGFGLIIRLRAIKTPRKITTRFG